MKSDAVNCTIFQPNGRNPFQLAPAPRPERFSEATNLAYPVADGNRFNLFNPANNLEVFAHPPFRYRPVLALIIGKTIAEACAVL